MVRIPLYNKGLGPSQTIQSTSVGPRASSGVFEAPGRAVMQAGQSAAQTAFNFGMKQKEAETRKEGDNYFVNFSQEAEAFRRDNKDTDTDIFQANFKRFSDKKLKEIDQRKDLTNSQRESIKQSLSSTILSQNFKGQQESFRRGQIVRTTAATDALALKIKQASMVPPNHPDRIRISEEIDKQLDQNAVDGLRTGYSKQSIKLGFESLDFENRINASDTDEQFSAIERDLDKSGQSASARSAFRSKIKTRKRELRSESYNLAIGQITSLAVDFKDKKEIANAIMKGIEYQGVDNSGKEVIFNTSGLDNGQRLNLVNAVANPLFKDLTDTIQQDMVTEIVDANVKDLPMRRFLDPNFLKENEKTVEDVEEAYVEAAQQMQQKATRLIQEKGNFSEAVELFNDAEKILEDARFPNGKLIGREGKLGDKAARVLASVSTGRGDLLKAQEKTNRIDQVRAAMNMDVPAIAISQIPKVKDDEIQSVLNEEMFKFKDPQAQMSFLNKAGIKNKRLQELLAAGVNNMSDPNYFSQATEDDKKLNSTIIEIFENMKLYPQLVERHTNDTTLTWWKSFETLEEIHGAEGALKIMSVQKPDLDISLKMEKVEEQLSVSTDEIVDQPWFKFDSAPPQNTGYMIQEIKNLTREYLKLGVSEEKALERAGQQLANTHLLVGSVLIKRQPDFEKDGDLADIADISSFVAEEFIKNNPTMVSADDDLTKENIGLLNIEGTSNRFYLVRSGGFPIMNEQGQFMFYTKKDLLKMKGEAAKTKAEKNLEEINKNIAKQVEGVQREIELAEDRDKANVMTLQRVREAAKMKIGGDE